MVGKGLKTTVITDLPLTDTAKMKLLIFIEDGAKTTPVKFIPACVTHLWIE